MRKQSDTLHPHVGEQKAKKFWSLSVVHVWTGMYKCEGINKSQDVLPLSNETVVPSPPPPHLLLHLYI